MKWNNKTIKKMRKILFFNMVEIALAFGIIGVGVGSIMSLISVGVSSSKDAIGDNNAPAAARTFISYFQKHLINDWGTYVDIGSPHVSLPEAPDGSWSEVRWVIRRKVSSNYVNWAFEEGGDESNNSDYDQGQLVDVADTNGLKQYKKSGGDETNMYRYAPSGGFKCDIRVWKTKVYAKIGAFDGDMGYSHAVAILVEVSWPTGVAYSDRQKRYYRYEIFKPDA